MVLLRVGDELAVNDVRQTPLQAPQCLPPVSCRRRACACSTRGRRCRGGSARSPRCAGGGLSAGSRPATSGGGSASGPCVLAEPVTALPQEPVDLASASLCVEAGSYRVRAAEVPDGLLAELDRRLLAEEMPWELEVRGLRSLPSPTYSATPSGVHLVRYGLDPCGRVGVSATPGWLRRGDPAYRLSPGLVGLIEICGVALRCPRQESNLRPFASGGGCSIHPRATSFAYSARGGKHCRWRLASRVVSVSTGRRLCPHPALTRPENDANRR